MTDKLLNFFFLLKKGRKNHIILAMIMNYCGLIIMLILAVGGAVSGAKVSFILCKNGGFDKLAYNM